MPRFSNDRFVYACLFSVLTGFVATLIYQINAFTGASNFDWLQLCLAFLAPMTATIAMALTQSETPEAKPPEMIDQPPPLVLKQSQVIHRPVADDKSAHKIDCARTTFGEIKANAVQVNQSTKERVNFIEDLLKRCEKINESATQLHADAEDTSTAIETVESITLEVSGSVGNLRQDTANVVEDVTKFIAIADDFATQFSSVKEATATLNELGMKVRLLSLNASVEAARAGDAGRGFSVIAEEVRALADQSSLDTAKIAGVVKTLENTLDQLTRQVTNVEDRLGKTYTQTETSFRVAEQAGNEIRNLSDQLVQFRTNMSAQLPAFKNLTRDVDQIKANTEAALSGSARNIALCDDALRSLTNPQPIQRLAS